MIAIYSRLSREDEESNSIVNQQKEGIAYANLNNFSEDEILFYNEGMGISGKAPIEKRPALFRLVNDIKIGKVKFLYVRSQKRLGRNLAIIEALFKIFKDYQIQLYLADRGLMDFNNPVMKLMVQIMGAFDELVPNEQSESTKRALNTKLQNGEIWGAIPFGYNKNEKNKPIILDDEASIIKRIFNESLSGIGAKSIAKRLNEDKIKTKSQNLLLGKYNDTKFSKFRNNSNNTYHTEIDRTKQIWTAATVYSMLTNSFYMGERIYNKVIHPVPAIITRKLYNDVQANFSNNRNNSGKSVDHQYLLKGIIFCDKCGRPYNGNRRFNKRENKRTKYVGNYYGCATKRRPNLSCDNKGINITKLESFIIKHLFKNKGLLDYLKEIDKEDDSTTELNNTLKSLKKEFKTKTKLLERYEDELFTDGLNESSKIRLRKKVNKTDTYISGLSTKIKNIEEQLNVKEDVNKISKIENTINSYSNNWTFQQYKEAIHSIIEKINIHSYTDENNKHITDVLINFKGFEETSSFEVKDKYSMKWFWTSQNFKKPTKEQMILDFEDYVGLYEEDDLKMYPLKKGKQLPEDENIIKQILNYKDVINDIDKLTELHFYIESGLNFNEDVEGTVITLEKEDIVEF